MAAPLATTPARIWARVTRVIAVAVATAVPWGAHASPARAQPPVALGRATVEALVFPPLVFDPPRAEAHEVSGVPVFHLHDPALPLVDVHVQVRGGMAHFPRERMASFAALPALLRSGGTLRLSPDSLDARIDRLALEISFASGGGGMAASLNALTPTAAEGLGLLREILLEPGFDPDAVETWRGQEIDRILRREDDPGGLAISAFNRLMFGDHPIGWITTPEDFSPERLAGERLRAAHSEVMCREHLIVGVAGDLAWPEAERLLREFLEPWPACAGALIEPTPPELPRERAVFVLSRPVDQSTIIVAGPGGILQDDAPEYFASRLADHVLGGSGLGSRLVHRLRTEEGLAYAAYSIWTAAPRSEGLVGAVTASGSARTVEATRVLIETLERMGTEPPSFDEISRAQEEIANGWVFAFPSSSQIVGRRMAYQAAGLSEDWLERYLEGIGEVTPAAMAEVVREHLDVEGMTILIVGDPARFDAGLETLGPLFDLDANGSFAPRATPPSAPGGSR